MNSYRFLLLFISLQCEKLSSNAQEVAASPLPRTDRQKDTARGRQTTNKRCADKANDFLYRPSRCLKTIKIGTDFNFGGLVVQGTVCVLSR